jgi:hypothetical protein
MAETTSFAAATPLSAADLAAVRAHPEFRAAVEAYAAENRARYSALDPIERWMVSDMGRASLSGLVTILDAFGQLTPAAILASPPVVAGEVSRGRARLYLQRAQANGLIALAGPGDPLKGDTPLTAGPRLRAVFRDIMEVSLRAAARLGPEAATALARMAEPVVVRRISGAAGLLLAAHPELFPLDAPVRLFQDRDGGTRMLDELILRQPARRERLLQSCTVSRSALARASHCSRIHVIRLLKDGEAAGLLSLRDGVLTASPQLSDDAERYFAATFALTRAAAVSGLARA